MKKRLAIFLGGLYGGGAERIILNLASGLTARGYEVDLVLAREIGPYFKEVPSNVRLINFRAKRAVLCLPQLIRYLKREQPSALLSAINYVNILALWARKFAGTKQRVIISEHNTYTLSKQQMSFFYQYALTRAMKSSYRWADGIIAVSEGVAEDLAKVTGISRNDISVIYNPIITPLLATRLTEPLDHPWFEPGQPPVLLAIGRLTKQKNFPLLIRSFYQLQKIRAARLIILGEGGERAALTSLIKELGLDQCVSMPGFVQNPYPYIAKATLFILSSNWEGLPTVLVEALYCGTPVIATDCPNGPREILRDGKFGALIPMNNVDALTQAILSALDKKKIKPDSDSWQPYKLDVVVSQYEKLLMG